MRTITSVADRPTVESIEANKAYQQQERAKVQAVTGLRITDLDSYTILCPRCLYPATGANEGRAIRALGHHVTRAHFPQHVKEQR